MESWEFGLSRFAYTPHVYTNSPGFNPLLLKSTHTSRVEIFTLVRCPQSNNDLIYTYHDGDRMLELAKNYCKAQKREISTSQIVNANARIRATNFCRAIT